MSEGLIVIVGGIVVGVIVVSLILREFWCWYWKINKLVSLQEQQQLLLKKLSIDVSTNEKDSDKGGETVSQPTVWVIKQATDFRIFPSYVAKTLTDLYVGEVVTKIEEKGEWWKICRNNGQEGWCISDCIERT